MSDTQNVPSTRKESMESGNVFFFTGQPCKQGHIALRYTTSSACVECNSEYAKNKLARFKEAKARAEAKAKTSSGARRNTQVAQESESRR